MRFDRTFIAIRERTTLGILDLALHVIVDHIRPLSCLLIINALPWILLDVYLVGHLLSDDYEAPAAFAFYWATLILVISQAQLGTYLITQYLGKAMFEGQPRVLEVASSFWKITPYFWFSQGTLRMAIFAILVCLIFDGDSDNSQVAIVLLFFVVSAGCVVRAFRPFVTEVLVLEKTPIRAKPNIIHFGARSKSLHAFASNDLIGKSIVTAAILAGLLFATHSMFLTIDQVMNVRANSAYSLQPVYFVVSLWIVTGFASVVRFLYYIDLRIKQEGWAVELKMRAEAQRMEEAVE
ncbi:MAG: hypothetical protein AAFN77_05720 [Planctomycetota bacterium]